MSLAIRCRRKIDSHELVQLEQSMVAFYSNPPPSYYQIADESSGRYNSRERPFHCHLLDQVRSGDSVLELGCGTAHLCTGVEQRGGRYTGVDYDKSLLEKNRQKFPNASFLPMNAPLPQTFDVVASLYTIEHVVDPPAYLDRMRRHCKLGGLMGIICPEFVESVGFPPSLYFGTTPRRLREKLTSFSLVDAIRHVLDLKFAGPRWKRMAQGSPPGDFWINLKPRVLHGAAYTIDADAVHFSRLKDLVRYFEEKGDEILITSQTMTGVAPEILQFNCYALARKGER